MLGIQYCRAQHSNEEQLEADQDEADHPVGQKRKRAGNEASPPHGSTAPHSAKGAVWEPRRLQWGPGHQPTARSPAAGGWAQGNKGTLTASRRRVLVSSPAPSSPVGEHGAGTAVSPAAQPGLVRDGGSPAAQQHSPSAAGSPVPGETPVGWSEGVVGSAPYQLCLHQLRQHSPRHVGCFQLHLMLLPVGHKVGGCQPLSPWGLPSSVCPPQGWDGAALSCHVPNGTRAPSLAALQPHCCPGRCRDPRVQAWAAGPGPTHQALSSSSSSRSSCRRCFS